MTERHILLVVVTATGEVHQKRLELGEWEVTGPGEHKPPYVLVAVGGRLISAGECFSLTWSG